MFGSLFRTNDSEVRRIAQSMERTGGDMSRHADISARFFQGDKEAFADVQASARRALKEANQYGDSGGVSLATWQKLERQAGEACRKAPTAAQELAAELQRKGW